MTGIGERIRKKRLELKMSQDTLAKKVGYTSRSTINKIEKGVSDITQTKVIEFAKALNTTPSFLMGGEENKSIDDRNTALVAKRIRDLREIRDMSLSELANELGITTDELERYEKGSERVPFELVQKMSDYFGVDALHNLGLEYQLNPNETRFDASIRILKITDRWNKEVGETQFTDDEMTKLIGFARYLLSERGNKK